MDAQNNYTKILQELRNQRGSSRITDKDLMDEIRLRQIQENKQPHAPEDAPDFGEIKQRVDLIDAGARDLKSPELETALTELPALQRSKNEFPYAPGMLPQESVKTPPAVLKKAPPLPSGKSNAQLAAETTAQEMQASAINNLEDTDFRDAQNEANSNAYLSRMLQIGNNLSKSIVNRNNIGAKDITPAGGEIFNEMQKSANSPLDQLKLKRTQYKEFLENKTNKEKSDPNSAVSDAARKSLKLLDPTFDIRPDMSAADIEKIYGPMTQAIGIKEARADREAARSERNLAKQGSELDRKSQTWEKNLKDSAAYKRYQENQEAYEFARKITSKEIDPNGVDDAALVLQAVKLAQADASVVRESDQKLFESAGGLSQTAQSLTQKIIGGGKLTPQVRAAYLRMMLNAQSNLGKSAKEQTSHIYKKYKDAGISEDYIPGTLQQLNKFSGEDSKVSKSVKSRFYSPSTNKTKLIYTDGTEEIFDGKK